MKILRSTLRNWAIFGISQNHRPFNGRNLLVLTVLGCGIVSACVHFFYESDTFQESTESVLMGTVMMTGIINFSTGVSKMRKSFESLNDAEQIIDGSEYS